MCKVTFEMNWAVLGGQWQCHQFREKKSETKQLSLFGYVLTRDLTKQLRDESVYANNNTHIKKRANVLITQ